MKGFFCVILSLLVSNLNVQSSSIDMDKNLGVLNEDDYKTTITDLNADCLFTILENLDLGDLITVAQVNSELSLHATDFFRHKYSQKLVCFSSAFKFPDEIEDLMNANDTKIDTDTIERIIRNRSDLFNKTPNIQVQKYYFDLNDFNSIFKTFKYFGNEIKEVSIQTFSWTPSWRTELLGYLISEYSAESLVDVTFDSDVDKLFQFITKPLVNIENVRFQSTFLTFKSAIIGFTELFPAVRRLYLDTVHDADLVNFNCHMPQLEHISLSRHLRDDSFMPDIIIKNPQIKSIDLRFPKPEFLQRVSTLLPQLESLRLERFWLKNESIRFENVTIFDTAYAEYTAPTNLHFPKLQTLKVDGVSARFNEYLAFLNEHDYLNHLHLKGYYMNDSEFQQLTANLTDLAKVTLEYRSNTDDILKLSAESVIKFVESHQKMKQLNVINYPKHWVANVQEQLKHEWIIKTIDGGMSFERMKNN